jgi:hypothetical protein
VLDGDDAPLAPLLDLLDFDEMTDVVNHSANFRTIFFYNHIANAL